MATYTPSPLGTLANEQAAVAKINENLTNIAAAMEGKLSRTDNNLPNHMSRDLDMNSNDLLNVGAVFADRIVATEPPPDPFGNSEFVNYTPQGSGAVQRTVQDKLREVVSPEDFGAVGDGVTNDANAFELAAATGRTLRLAGAYRFNSNIAIANQLVFDGGVIRPASGVVVTLTGELEAGRSQIFDLSLGGTVAGLSGPDELWPEWWGAVANGLTDCQPAFAAAIAAAPANGGIIGLSDGEYRISTLSIAKEITIRGKGKRATTISTNGVTAFNIQPGVNAVSIIGMGVVNDGDPYAAGTSGIRAVATALATGIGYLTVRDVYLYRWARGIDAQFCQLGLFEDVHALDNTVGVYQKRSVNMIWRSVLGELNPLWGAYIDGDSGAVTESAGTLIDACQFVNNGSSGGTTDGGNIAIFHNEHFELKGCMIDVPSTGSRHNVRMVGVQRAAVALNWIGAGKDQGIYMTSCNDCIVQGNNIVSSASYGLGIESGTRTVVSGNVFTANAATDILIYGTSNGTAITGNVCGSTTSAQSIQETGAFRTAAVGNVVARSVTLDGTSVNANNIAI